MPPEQEARLQQQEHRTRSSRALEERRRREEEQVLPSTEIENSVISKMAEIGVYPYAVYSVLKMRQSSGEANPSYAEIARMTGMDRSTVIRSVKKLEDLNLLTAQRRRMEDGAPATNQYNLRSPESR